MRTIRCLLAGITGMVLLSGPASAATMVWTLNNVTFGDGGTATGSFAYDATSNVYSLIAITTSDESFPGATYGVVDVAPALNIATQVAFIDSASAGALPNRIGANRLFLTFAAPLTDAGGTISLELLAGASEGICQNSTCLPPPGGPNIRFVTGGSVSASPIPVPPAVWLFGGALGVLGWLRRKPAG